MLNINNWALIGNGSWVSSFSNMKFSIVLDENGLYDVTAAVKVGNADFFNQVNNLESLDKAKEAADSIAIKAYGLSPLAIKIVPQSEKESQARRAEAVKNYSQASRYHAMLLMSMVNSIPPNLNDFLKDPNYVWFPRDPSGRLIDFNNPRPRPI